MIGGAAPGQLYFAGQLLAPLMVSGGIADTGANVSDTLRIAAASRAVSDTGATVTDSVSVIKRHIYAVSFSEQGALVSDSVTPAFAPASPSRLAVDSYADGTATIFGAWSRIEEPLCIFSDAFFPYEPPPDETESYYADLPFIEAEHKFAETRPMPGTAKRATCAWHGLMVDDERGARVVVRAGGEFEGLIGERVRIVPSFTHAGAPVVVGYVHAVADLDPRDDLSVTRRMFMDLGLLGLDRIEVVVETLT